MYLMFRSTGDLVSALIAGAASSGTSAAGLAGMMSEHEALTTSTWIPLGLFLGGIGLTAMLVWKTATTKSEMDTTIKSLKGRVKWLEDVMKKDGKGAL